MELDQQFAESEGAVKKCPTTKTQRHPGNRINPLCLGALVVNRFFLQLLGLGRGEDEMRKATACLLLWSLAVAAGTAVELPAGTEIQIRLRTKVASHQSRPEDRLQAVVIIPVLAAGQVAIPAGAELIGKIKEARPSGEGEQRAVLELDFGELSGAEGKGTKLTAKVRAIDNGREQVDDGGRILGIKASETLSAQMDRALEKLGQRAARLAEFLQVAKSAVLRPADVEIVYEPGVEMTLELVKSVAVEAAGEEAMIAGKRLGAIRGEAELAALVNAQPFQTMAEKPPQPSDIMNLMFLGSREKLEAAFAAAGWATAALLDASSGLETFRAIVENRGYKEAPVSTLLLEGKKPDLVFQKQNNTFAMRHHLRIWKRPQSFDGQDVWVSAATHDVDIEFSPETRTFIHKIDSQIDRERAKVVHDLLLTGPVKGLALVERPAAPRESRNATGDKLETDGRMAVLELQ